MITLDEIKQTLLRLGFVIIAKSDKIIEYRHRMQLSVSEDERTFRLFIFPPSYDYANQLNDAANYIYNTGRLVENDRIQKAIKK